MKEEEIYKRVDSWFTLPIKENKLGAVSCDVCGGILFIVRAKEPKREKRVICPTCCIETLEMLKDNLNSEEKTQVNVD